MSFKLGKSSKINLKGVNAQLYAIIELALTISKVDFGIPSNGGLRTADEQHKLFIEGQSQLDGYNKKSNHQSGNAFDVFAYVDGAASYDEKDLLEVATAILAAASQLKIRLRWGGHWVNFVDIPHFELVI